MSKKMRIVQMSMIVAAAFVFHNALAQNAGRPASGAETKTAAAGDTTDRAKALRAAADALGMIRWSDIGAGATRLPGIDVVNTMEIFASGTVSNGGQSSTADYHVALAYIPPSMRVEITRKGGDAASQHTIQTVRENYAWNESEIGAGLIPGKGTATPAMPAAKARLLQLWILPYGVVKAAIAAGDKTKVSAENGGTVITFPLSGSLAGITVTATLDSKFLVTKVETRPDNPALANLATETEYSDYADHGEVLTDIKSPGHIVEKQAGKTMLDLQVKMIDANNPYLVFPVPANVKAASTSASAGGASENQASAR
jgi:hypothetical protein